MRKAGRLLGVALAGWAAAAGLAAAQAPAVPCAACTTWSITTGQAEILSASSDSFTGLPLLISLGNLDISAGARALASLAARGAIVGFELRLHDKRPDLSPIADASMLLVDATAGSADLTLDHWYQLKIFLTDARARLPRARLGVKLGASTLLAPSAAAVSGYVDFIVLPADADVRAAAEKLPGVELWSESPPFDASDLADLVLPHGPAKTERTIVRLPAGSERFTAALAELHDVLPDGLTPLTGVSVACDRPCHSETYLHPRTLDAIAVVHPEAPVAHVSVAPAATALTVYGDARRTVADQSIDVAGTTRPFVMRIQGWRGVAEDAFTEEVQVGGARQLRVDEIIARHQAARARQDSAVRTLISSGSTVLTLSVPGFAGPLTVAAQTTTYVAGGVTDIEQRNITINGLDLHRAADVPRLPLVEPERVSTPPLRIALTEAYQYRLLGRERVSGRDTYLVGFEPRASARPIVSGRAWIDAGTFGLVKMDTIETAGRGPVVSSRQIDEFDRIDDKTPLSLVSRSEIFQIYEGPTESTPIRRVTTFDRHEVNAPDFETRLDAAHRSNALMLRDTPEGLRYLTSGDTDGTGRREIRSRAPHRTATAVAGSLFDPNIDIPLVFGGVSYVDFDVLKSGTQVNGFYGGTYARLSWATPPIIGRGWRLSGDGYGVAVSYNDRAIHQGVERYAENIRQRPAHLSIAVLGPLIRSVRLRAAYELDYTKYAPATTTADTFVVPASTPVHGAKLALEHDRGPWNAGVWWNVARRQRWTPWGLSPAAAQLDSRVFERYGANLSRSFVWSPRAVGRLEGAWMGGRRLDRFNRFAFGAFDNPLRGYPTATVRYDHGAVVRSVATWTAASRLRLDGFADVASVHQPDFGATRIYPGIGAAVEAPLPGAWLLAVEWGYGVKGLSTNGRSGTHVIRVSGYKIF